jgi:hypothetical protein
MEAARVAALAGHRVILAEAQSQLGGAVRIAQLAPHARALGDITYWLEQEIYRLGVEVRTSTYLDAHDALSEAANTIIVATGSLPRRDGFQLSNPGAPIAGYELPHVLSSMEVLAQPKGEAVARAVVLDSVGHMEGVSVAEHLLARGAEVTFVSHLASFAPVAQAAGRDGHLLQRLHAHRTFTLLLRCELVSINSSECVVRPLYDLQRRHTQTVPADLVVMVTPNEPLRSVYDDLRSVHGDVRLVGDALSPRDLQIAIAEGHQAGRSVGSALSNEAGDCREIMPCG